MGESRTNQRWGRTESRRALWPRDQWALALRLVLETNAGILGKSGRWEMATSLNQGGSFVLRPVGWQNRDPDGQYQAEFQDRDPGVSEQSLAIAAKHRELYIEQVSFYAW